MKSFEKFNKHLWFIIIIISGFCVNCFSQGIISKCKTCGQLVEKCNYHGNHPKCKTCGLLVEKCKHKGNHPKCKTCGLLVEKCRHKGNHPKCKICGLLVEKCKHKGKHPKCKTCGLLAEKCKYKGKHPQKNKSEVSPQQSNSSNDVINNETNSKVSGFINGYEWVDLGLSVKWATHNVGALTATDSGNYYYWCLPEIDKISEWENFIEYIVNNNKNEESPESHKEQLLEPSTGFDIARESWKGTWRMPSKSEVEELNEKCNWSWTSDNGVNGFVVTGPNGKSIFLPASGYQNNGNENFVGEEGYYWTRSYRSKNDILCMGLHFTSPKKEMGISRLTNTTKVPRPKGGICYAGPHRGHMVRPVTE